MHSWLQLTGKF